MMTPTEMNNIVKEINIAFNVANERLDSLEAKIAALDVPVKATATKSPVRAKKA
tara:strand:+ start:154 stop:315 length:162 start_codon:yes stop_codon:yes gene_type:complete